ncbi:MAG: hypothetical protein MJ053_03800 [Elusimicrobiaceae bacterium]|nr:hypothetical protein [Elusimicrobiaceae bacterium]
MPTVPTYPYHKRLTGPQATAEPIAQPNESSVTSQRLDFMHQVQEEVKTKGQLSETSLDQLAVSHLNEESANTPAAWDYAALRYTAKHEAGRDEHQHQIQQLEQEERWTQQVSATLPDSASLKTYLDLQIPAYKTRLQQAGLNPQEVQEQAARLQAQAVVKNMSYSLAQGDWQTAQQVLEDHGAYLSEATRISCARQVCQSYARAEAARLWRQGALQQANQPQQTQTWALEHLEEPNASLRENIRREIDILAETAHRKTAADQAVVYEQLAHTDVPQAQELLETQQVLSEPMLEQALQAVRRSQTPASDKQQAWFVKNYCQARPAQVQEAFEKGLCSGRDYLLLQARQLQQQAGQDTSAEDWLLRGINVWMNRQGFDGQDITRATYAVLSGAGRTEDRLQIWQKIKTLLTC